MKKRTFLPVLLAFGAMTTFSSCDKKEEEVVTVTGSYVLAVTADGSSSEATDYILQSSDLMSGEISPVGQGIEQKSYRMYELVGKTLLSITYQNPNTVPGYVMNAEGKLVQKTGQFSVNRLHARNPIDQNTMFGMTVPRDGSRYATLYEIDVNSMTVLMQKQIDVFEAAGNGVEWAYFNDIRKVDNKIFIPFFQIKNNLFESAYTDTAYIAVYSYPDFKLEKVMKDARTGTLAVYASNDAMSVTENGDIYAYSSTALSSGVQPSTKPSGILRIKKGTTEFDQNYFMNIEEITGGYKLNSIKYVGNGKALAQIYSFKTHEKTDLWTGRDCKLAVIDFVAKSVTYVSGVPLHTGSGGGLKYKSLVEGDNVYAQISNAEGIYIYRININSATGTKGAHVQGKAVMGMYKMDI
ncbi:MAG: DUF4374 domain-containing protein [Bacteroidota bacterium]